MHCTTDASEQTHAESLCRAKKNSPYQLSRSYMRGARPGTHRLAHAEGPVHAVTHALSTCAATATVAARSTASLKTDFAIMFLLQYLLFECVLVLRVAFAQKRTRTKGRIGSGE